MKSINLIFVPPGQRRDMANMFKDISPDSEVFDIETMLKESLNMGNVHLMLSSYTREFIQIKWREIILTIIRQIKNSEKNNFFLIGHAVYFANSRREYYSVVDTNYVKTTLTENNLPSVSHVVLIIDDVVDTFNSLKGDTELFGTNTQIGFLGNYKKNFNIEDEQTSLDYKFQLNWIHYCLTSLLSWRSQEVILSETFAGQLSELEQKCKFLLWGLKQNIHVLIKLLSNNKKILYLSHAISKPRKKFKESGEWVEPVITVNQIQQKLIEKNIHCLLPTAIDEYRFDKNNQNFTSKLTERWPIPEFVSETLSKYNILFADYHNLDVFELNALEYEGKELKLDSIEINESNQEYVNGVLGSIEMNIAEQLANRDHTLVRSTDGIIVLNPLGDNLIFHGGVRKELYYLRQINLRAISQARLQSATPNLKNLTIVIMKDIAKRLLDSDSFKISVKSELGRIISHNVEGISTLEAEELIDEKLNLLSTSQTGSMGILIEPAIINSQIRPSFDENKKNVISEIFLLMVSTMTKDHAPIDVIIVDELEDILTEQNIQRMKNFQDNPTNFDWESYFFSIIS